MTDGRSARAQRTRDAVVESLLACLRDGNLRPTAKEIADRAGISVRSVYVHFEDLDDLMCAASERQGRDIVGMLEVVPSDLPFDDRLRAVIDQRVRVFEAVGPVKRAGGLQEPFSVSLARIFDDMRAVQRAELERVFAPELAAMSETDRAAALDAAHLLALEESWSLQRVALGRSVAEARAAIEVGLRLLLGGTR